jgi:hypothetical protein
MDFKIKTPDRTHSTCRGQLKFDGTRAETRIRLSAKRTSPFKSAGASVQSTTGSRGVRISGSTGSNAGYTMFRGSAKGTGYSLHSPVSPSLSLPCITVCHHISTGVYHPHLSTLYHTELSTRLTTMCSSVKTTIRYDIFSWWCLPPGDERDQSLTESMARRMRLAFRMAYWRWRSCK